MSRHFGSNGSLEKFHHIALIADAHGHADILTRALEACRVEHVDALVLLGDLIDHHNQADACVDVLRGWNAFGVFGNHEEEIIDAMSNGAGLTLSRATVEFFQSLQPRIVLGDACFMHDELELPRNPRLPVILSAAKDLPRAEEALRSVQGDKSEHRIVFTGHTHHRAAVSDHGPLDTAHDLRLDPARRYVINPGALVGGKFATWNRVEQVVRFRQVK